MPDTTNSAPTTGVQGDSTTGEGAFAPVIDLSGLEIPNPIQDLKEIFQESRPAIAKGAWIVTGILVIGFGILVITFSSISGVVRETAYEPAKQGLKEGIKARAKGAVGG